jgi:chromate transporter
MMEQEFVSCRQWVSREKFLDLVGAASLIPGPSSSEVAIYIGQLLGGFPGLLIAGVCFILPAALMVLGIAWVYVKFGSLPQVAGILYGIKPVIIAIVLQALFTLGRAAIKTRILAAIGLMAFILNMIEINILLILLFAGLASVLSGGRRNNAKRVATLLILMTATTLAATQSKVIPTLSKIFLFFLKIGSIQFGSGYVLLAFLREDLVKNWHWLTEAQLLDATAVGQFTPGPVFTTATFIGYLLGGVSGAVLATIGIFLPAFVLVSISGSLIPKIRQSISAGAFLDGVIVASLALMAHVSVVLGRVALVDWLSIALAFASVTALVRFRTNSAWLVLVGATIGFFVQITSR